ncbi:hypothetical protein D3C75_1190030 [compost metagenome]
MVYEITANIGDNREGGCQYYELFPVKSAVRSFGKQCVDENSAQGVCRNPGTENPRAQAQLLHTEQKQKRCGHGIAYSQK